MNHWSISAEYPDTPDHANFWYDKDGNFTDKESEVARKEPVEILRWRLAKAGEHTVIYDREFLRTKMENTPENHRLFNAALKKHIRALIDKHLANRNYTNTDFEVISTAESFLNWLDIHMIGNPKPATELAKAVNAKVVDKLPYDLDHHRLFSFDDAIKIHYHFNDGDDQEAHRQLVFNRENMQLAIRFEELFAKADERSVIDLLEKQYKSTAVTGTPETFWLDNVEKIIAHHQLLKRPEYAKHDTVKLWFKEKREKLKVTEMPEVPFIGQLFHTNFNIGDVVIDAYYRQVRQPKSRDEISTSYVGRTHRHNDPYRVQFYGAFINMDTWDLLEFYRKDKVEPYDQVTDEEINSGLQRYANGFKNGYANFEKELLGNNPFPDNAHKAQLIFDFATGRMGGMHSLPISYGGNVHFFAGWEAAGFEEGKLYRAWYLMLENHSLFTGLFESRIAKHSESGLKIDQVALLYVFEQKIITRKNGNEVAASFGHTSGEKLFQRFTYYSNHTNRTTAETTSTKLSNKIKLFESITEHLSPEYQSKLSGEIEALKNLLATVWAK